MEIQQLFVESVLDLAKDLMTIASGIVGLSITFLKDVVNGFTAHRGWALKWCWFMYLVSIVFGFWTLMAVSGSLERALSSIPLRIELGFNVRTPAVLQILAFATATTLLVIYGTSALHSFRSKKK
jgi:hypothetical protein